MRGSGTLGVFEPCGSVSLGLSLKVVTWSLSMGGAY